MIKPPTKFIDLDFETRSRTAIATGAWRYSICESTDVLWLKYSIKGKMYTWRIGDKPPGKLFRYLKKGYHLRAFNSFFEYCIWKNVCETKLGWPSVDIGQFYCVQAMAQAKSFPGSLAGAAEALELPTTKDKEGKRLINMFSKPSRKADEDWKEPENYPEDFARFGQYCEVDVDVQIGIAEAVGPLSDFEYNVFLMTERINAVGLPIDIDMVYGAINLVAKSVQTSNGIFQRITGTTLNLSQKAAIKNWLEEDGLPLPNMQAGTLDKKIKSPKIHDRHRKILSLIRSAGKISTSKYKKAIEIIGSDFFIHGILKYHRARTGRWGGVGIQPQNFARTSLPGWVDYEYLAQLIAEQDYEIIEVLYGDVMEALSSALRSMICAVDGKKLVTADYAQIEARVGFWVAGEEEALEVFRQNKDIYKVMAMDIYKKKEKDITSDERFIGKQCILGLGFQMGAKKFKKNLYDQFDTIIPTEFAEENVAAYRKKYPRVKKIWGELNKAAIKAVDNINCPFAVGPQRLIYEYDGEYLTCKLPSGRKIHYYNPRVCMVASPWAPGEKMAQLTFMGVDGFTNKWTRLSTYGGMLLENAVQAIARDLMCCGMINAEEHGYPSLFTVHDESISMVPDEPCYSYQEYEKLLSKTPDWAKGIPVVAEGWEGKRYRK
jgi:DNA polymerase bacteriophage-type